MIFPVVVGLDDRVFIGTDRLMRTKSKKSQPFAFLCYEQDGWLLQIKGLFLHHLRIERSFRHSWRESSVDFNGFGC